MTNLQDLLSQKTAVEQQIAALKPAAVEQVRNMMAVLGVTPADMGLAPVAAAGQKGSKRPVKYRDSQGNTWTGVGQRPRWLQAQLLAGATIEQFRVK